MTEAEWLECTDPTPMLEFMREKASERKSRLFAVGCCRRVWPRLLDERSRDAVETIEKHIEGKVTDDQLRKAGAEAGTAFRDFKEQVFASFVGPALAHRAMQTPRGLDDVTDVETARDVQYRADNDHTVLAASAVWGAASHKDDEDVQFALSQGADYSLNDYLMSYSKNVAIQTEIVEGDLAIARICQAIMIRDLFGNPFRPITIDVRWLTSTVVDLARAIYDERAFHRMLILADALMDAGCDSEAIITHCRQSSGHVRGCWVIDLITEKK